ncbi:MAG TPA: hypothetical protein VFV19_03335 [Candidatus Polarisedimenticolaceae bacterium]|nr:hypothetical protein [Candidatus Polarisedimenticolaceae bacterium]
MRRSGPLTLLVLTLAACATRQPMTGQTAPSTDRKLSKFAFIEEGKLVTLIVDTRATRYREKEKYVPVEIAIANRGVKQMALTRESFTLTDEKGARYPCASPKELLDNYEFLDLDRDLQELPEIVFNRFGAMNPYPSKFSPTRSVGTVVTDHVELPRYGYVIDMLYFPAPATGLKGHKFELAMTAPELADPIFVKFFVE